MNADYTDVKEKAAQWGLTPRQVQLLCARGKIPGARRFGRSWAIPAEAAKPADGRRAYHAWQLDESMAFAVALRH